MEDRSPPWGNIRIQVSPNLQEVLKAWPDADARGLDVTLQHAFARITVRLIESEQPDLATLFWGVIDTRKLPASDQLELFFTAARAPAAGELVRSIDALRLHGFHSNEERIRIEQAENGLGENDREDAAR